MEQLRQEKQEIDQQLRAIHGNSIGSVQNFPSQRRSERGYSSDLDSLRSNRGGGNQNQGGPRGRGGRGGRGNNQRYHAGMLLFLSYPRFKILEAVSSII